MHYVGANLGQNWAKVGDALSWILTPTQGFFHFHVSKVCAEVHQIRLRIATVNAWTDRHCDKIQRSHSYKAYTRGDCHRNWPDSRRDRRRDYRRDDHL